MSDTPPDAPAEAEEDYYLLCPTRPLGQESLISHLISRDMCEERQATRFHKCPNCVRSRLWKAAHPHDGAAHAATSAAGS